MYACICNAVTVDEVGAAVDSGADSIAALGSMTAAGTCCMNCHDHLEEIIEARCGACPLANPLESSLGIPRADLAVA